MFFIDFRKEEGERETNIGVREKHWSASSHVQPKQGLSLPPFSVWDDAPADSAAWPGLVFITLWGETFKRLVNITVGGIAAV